MLHGNPTVVINVFSRKPWRIQELVEIYSTLVNEKESELTLTSFHVYSGSAIENDSQLR